MYWQAIMTHGGSICGKECSLLSVNRLQIREFQIVADSGQIVFATTQFVTAWRRRTQQIQGGGKRMIHIVELPKEVVFVFEDTGKVIRSEGYGTESWNAPIDYHPSEPRGIHESRSDSSLVAPGV